MLSTPEAAPLPALFAAEFTAPTAARFHVITAAILTTGRRTVPSPARSAHSVTSPPASPSAAPQPG